MMNPRATYSVRVANSGQARILEVQRTPYVFLQVTQLGSEPHENTVEQFSLSLAQSLVKSAKLGWFDPLLVLQVLVC